MSVLDVVYEGSTSYLTITFHDKNGEPVAPGAITWKAHDHDTGTVLQAETAVEIPAATIEITIPPAVNTLVKATKTTEVRVITIRASYGLADVITDEHRYVVRNLAGV
jgi:hypothetical protein